MNFFSITLTSNKNLETSSKWKLMCCGFGLFVFKLTQLLFMTKEQGNLIQGKAQLALKNWKNLFGDQKEDSLIRLEVCYLTQ